VIVVYSFNSVMSALKCRTALISTKALSGVNRHGSSTLASPFLNPHAASFPLCLPFLERLHIYALYSHNLGRSVAGFAMDLSSEPQFIRVAREQNLLERGRS
jgi:hypothetical protein